ncbi:MAG: hypothetical protein MRY72_06810 [Aquisalinus sp.]|nr:hypothetical protein [Aquisalinus sp.]
MKWTKEQLKNFEANRSIGPDAVYADKIMRPMAEVYCPDILEAFDQQYNLGAAPLGPNWHVFAADFGPATVEALKLGHLNDLKSYFTFLNWAAYEPTSYLSEEVIITPLADFTYKIKPEDWMIYFPMQILDKVIQYTQNNLVLEISRKLRVEQRRLNSRRVRHDLCWAPLHKSFSKTAEKLGVPFTNLL